ncbi:MAG: hypothetical protein QNJ97_17105 [Myxococcota bacterium]|nr:hypothetical protein [Myxococcota bacterium]
MFVAFLLFRYVYYDELLPNTFFAKPDDWIGSTTFPEGGLNYTNIFHQRNGGYFLIPLIVLLLGMKAHFGKVLFILGVISGGIVFVFYANVDWMQNERFYIPYMGLFYAGALAAIIYLVSSSLRRMWPGILFLLTLFIFSGLDQIQRARTIGKHEASYPYHLMSCIYLDRVGKDLFQKYRGKGVLATKRAGAIPYYSKLKTIDAYGLNDREIAKAFHENEPTKRRRLAVDIAFKKGPTMTLSFTTRRLSAPKAATIADAKNFSGLDRYLFEKAIKNGFKFEKEYRTGKVEWGYIFKKPDGSISGT